MFSLNSIYDLVYAGQIITTTNKNIFSHETSEYYQECKDIKSGAVFNIPTNWFISPITVGTKYTVVYDEVVSKYKIIAC